MNKRPSTHGSWDAAMPVLMSFLIPGVGHVMLGLRIRGAIWLAGWVALLLLGAGHMIPGLLLMVASGVDAAIAGRLRRSASPKPTS